MATEHLKHWMHSEVRRIGQDRFDSTYWPWIDQALQDALESHSVVLRTPQDTLAGFVLVCPTSSPSAKLYPLNLMSQNTLSIAFVAVDKAWEGKGLARRMLSEVLLCCKATHQNCWLHVDTHNPRARGLYESLGFQANQEIPDVYGSHGSILLYSVGPKYRRDSNMKIWPTLFNARPGQSEQAFAGGIVAPPLVAST
jgi:ribosomal protein S18 acetylase RimI-like enzyme